MNYQATADLLILCWHFKVDVFYKLVDVVINQLAWRFEGQRQVAELFKFLFSDTMLKLSDAELET